MADDVDEAVNWPEKAFEERDPELPYQKYYPRFPEAVMSHPGTLAIVEALNYPAPK